MSPRLVVLSVLLLRISACASLLAGTARAASFVPSARLAHGPAALRPSGDDDGDDENKAVADAERLLAKARAIREGLGETGSTGAAPASTGATNNYRQSEFTLPPNSDGSAPSGHRLYLDVGRESGTWMDPRWGASGRRIECTVDVSFPGHPGALMSEEAPSASDDIMEGLKKTVTSKSSLLSPAYELQRASYARLRGGFDKMVLEDGGYCVESTPGAASSTLRFCLSVSGTTDGDVSIPGGKLYFALPFFGTKTIGEGEDAAREMALSTKEGTICVKQMGWHTGWYREESRILGVFRAVPLHKARTRDKF